jgi:hypothetical protein
LFPVKKFVVLFFFTLFINTLTSNDIRMRSGHVTLHSSLRVKSYARLNISTNRTTSHRLFSVLNVYACCYFSFSIFGNTLTANDILWGHIKVHIFNQPMSLPFKTENNLWDVVRLVDIFSLAYDLTLDKNWFLIAIRTDDTKQSTLLC